MLKQSIVVSVVCPFCTFTVTLVPGRAIEALVRKQYKYLEYLSSFPRTHMQDLKDVTNNVHYENYRSRKLAAVTYNGVDNNRAKGQLSTK